MLSGIGGKVGLVNHKSTNNLDIQDVDILTAAVNEYQGTLIVVSRDVMAYEFNQSKASFVMKQMLTVLVVVSLFKLSHQ